MSCILEHTDTYHCFPQVGASEVVVAMEVAVALGVVALGVVALGVVALGVDA